MRAAIFGMRSAGVVRLLIAAALLTWPAVLNGYPLVFSDTGTYLSQALNHHLGWDRPVFYSLFLLVLHGGLTTWPVVAAQALLAAAMVRLTCRVARPEWSAWWSVAVTAGLAAASSLPWFASQLMPDLFTSLLILALALLILAPERLGRIETRALTGLAIFAIAAHLSHLPLALGLLAILTPLRRRLGARAKLGAAGVARVFGAPLAAALALSAVNLIGHGTPSLAPYGANFLLARVIYDGPGRDVLARDCPRAGWPLCAARDRLPANADDFLWSPASPLHPERDRIRGSAEATAIIEAAIRDEPGAVIGAVLSNARRQLALFESGDGLNAWPDTVTPWIRRDFPRFEQAAYAGSRQSTGRMLLPAWLGALHVAAGLAGVGVSLAALPGLLRRRDVLAGIAVSVLAGLVLNATITGALSGPHARYQSRVMWLPVLTMLLVPARRTAGS